MKILCGGCRQGVATQTPTRREKGKTPSPKRGDKVKKVLFTQHIRNAISAGDAALVKSSANIFAKRKSRGLDRIRLSPSTSDSSSPQSQPDSKGRCPVHMSSSAFGAAVRKNPGRPPKLTCTCSPEERRLAQMCVQCREMPPDCRCQRSDKPGYFPASSRRSTSTPAPTMVTRQGGVPAGHFDKETHAFLKIE